LAQLKLENIKDGQKKLIAKSQGKSYKNSGNKNNIVFVE